MKQTVKNWLHKSTLILMLLFSMVNTGTVFAITQNDLDAVVNDTVWYDPTSCSYEDDTDNPCTCSAGNAGTAASLNIPEPWRSLFIKAGLEYEASPNFLAALYLTEQGNKWLPFDTNWASSPVGASGPMQFMPGTWDGYGVDGNGDGTKDINDVNDAVFAAANLVTTGLNTNASTELGTLDQPLKPDTLLRAAASYNWGPGNVQNAGENAPISRLPTETENYLKNIHALFTSNFIESGHPNYGDPKPAGTSDEEGGTGLSICAGGGTATVDGFTFPLITTKSIIKEGMRDLMMRDHIWCYSRQTNCHHDYKAADIMVPTGTKVVAAIPGRVVSTKENTSVGSNVTIAGDDGRTYYYTHMGTGTIIIEVGQSVNGGDELGAVGTKEDGVVIEHLHIDALPNPPHSSRPGCAGAACSSLPFFELQPSLVKTYEALPE
jgi:hypothetical protein